MGRTKKIKTALVLGGSGFLGHHLANNLSSQGYHVVVVDKDVKKYNWISKDISIVLASALDFITLPHKYGFNNEFDIIYNCMSVDHFTTMYDGCSGLYIDAMCLMCNTYYDSRIINISSHYASDSNHIYGLLQKSNEQIINMHKNSINIRVPELFGEESIKNNYVDLIIFSLLNDTVFNVKCNKTLSVDFLYVLDASNEIIRIANTKQRGVTDIGYGKPIKLTSIYSKIVNLIKKDGEYKINKSSKKALPKIHTKHIIKEPKYGFDEGLRRTIKWHIKAGLKI